MQLHNTMQLFTHIFYAFFKNNFIMSVGQRVKEVRKRLRLNQTDFGEPLNIVQGTVSHMELDDPRQPVTEKTMGKMISVYGINPDYIYNGSGEMFTREVKDSTVKYGKVVKEVPCDELERLIKENEILNKEKQELIKEKEWYKKKIDERDALISKLWEEPDRLRVDKEKGVPWSEREL